MEFVNEKQRAAYESVQAITSQFADFGELEGAPGFALATESARVFIVLLPWAEDNAVMQVRAYLINEFEKSVELADHLLSLNSQVVLGAWGWEGRRVFYQYTVVADQIDETIFNLCMNAVVASVEGLGPHISTTWGTPDASADASGAACGTSGNGGCSCDDSCACTDEGCGCEAPPAQDSADA